MPVVDLERPAIRITPDHQPHKDLLSELEHVLRGMDRVTVLPPVCYHDVFGPDDAETLRQCNHLSAHYIRTRADRLAVAFDEARHPLQVFEYDAKTAAKRGRDQPDLCLELMPSAYHVRLRYHVDCLYVYRHVDGSEVGFWWSHPPKVRTVFIPDRHRDHVDEWERLAATSFPGSEIKHLTATRGSGDPFIVIDRQVWRSLPHWRDLLYCLVGETVMKLGTVSNGAYPSIGEGRPSWCNPAMSNMLSVYVDDYEARMQERDLLRIKAMPVPARRVAWSRARGSFRAAGLWADGGCNDQADVDEWSPLFRRFVVWLK